MKSNSCLYTESFEIHIVVYKTQEECKTLFLGLLGS